MSCLLEVCVENAEAAVRAVEGGAGRIELCADLAEDGLTPTAREIRATLEAVDVPVHVMVRCRPGGFHYEEFELERMEIQAEMARELGAHGLVIGALTGDDEVDRDAVQRLLERSGDLPVTFHRAFDHVADPGAALDELMSLKIERLLTSGGAPTAWEGRAMLRALVQRAAGRIVVMAGGGVRQHNVRELVAETGVVEVHSSTPLLP